jgi:hypothetical protein
MKIEYLETTRHNEYNILIHTVLSSEYNLDMFNENYAIYVNNFHEGHKSNFKQLAMACYLLSTPLNNSLKCDIILVKNNVYFIFKEVPQEMLQDTLVLFYRVMTKIPTANTFTTMKNKASQLLKTRFMKLDVKKSEIPFKEFFKIAYVNAYKSIVGSNVSIIGPPLKKPINEEKIKFADADTNIEKVENINLELKKPKFKIMKMIIKGNDTFKYIVLNMLKHDLQAMVGSSVIIEYFEGNIYAYTNDHINLVTSNINKLITNYTVKFKEPKFNYEGNDLLYNMIYDNMMNVKVQKLTPGDVKIEIF